VSNSQGIKILLNQSTDSTLGLLQTLPNSSDPIYCRVWFKEHRELFNGLRYWSIASFSEAYEHTPKVWLI